MCDPGLYSGERHWYNNNSREDMYRERKTEPPQDEGMSDKGDNS